MRYEFTPAAERALQAAAGWTVAGDVDPPHPAEILLGLLAEPECRAALLLAAHGIDAETVRHRWPGLRPVECADPQRATCFEGDWAASLRAAEQRLYDYPPPRVMATEHLLLGLAAAEHEVSAWLQGLGVEPDALATTIHRLSGHDTTALPLDFPEAQGDPQPATNRGEPTDGQFATGNNPSAAMATPTAPHEQLGILRIIDAAANRAGEGLRVIEDYTRFVLDDAHLTAKCKELRHELAAALAGFSPAERQAARDTQADVGTEIHVAAERSRATALSTVAASFNRVEQALRSLEEYTKVVQPSAAAALEQLRYRTYTLERALNITCTSLERLAAARLYVIVDGLDSVDSFTSLVQLLVEAGVPMLQLRDKKLSDRELLARARAAADVVRGSGTLFIMNDRPDLAVLSSADGVHVGQEELTAKDARAVVGPDALVGVSTHSLDQARAAVLAGANYIGVGPTFPSATKSFIQYQGTDLLHAVSGEIRLPAYAIGGITAANLPQVLASGFTRICVGAAVTGAADPAAAARELLDLLNA